MGFAIEADESVSAGVTRVLRSQLANVCERLAPNVATRKKSIHEARKSLKKARAVLRLARVTIGERAYRERNAGCRDIARTISAARDADVLLETFDGLLAAFRDHVSAPTFGTARRHLEKQAAQARVQDARAVRATATRARALLASLEKLAFDDEGWTALEPGLARIYRAARRGSRKCYEKPSDVAFHEWRKNVKYLRYHIDFLRGIWEAPLRELSSQLHDLSDLLGSDHDLAVLRDQVAADPMSFGETADVEALLMLISRRQEELRAAARPLGDRLFAERTRHFTARLGSYWATWHRPRSIQALAGAGESLAGTGETLDSPYPQVTFSGAHA